MIFIIFLSKTYTLFCKLVVATIWQNLVQWDTVFLSIPTREKCSEKRT